MVGVQLKHHPRFGWRTGIGALLVLAVMSTAACAAPQPEVVIDSPPTDSSRQWAEETIETMTPAQKVGQLFITHAYGRTADSTADEDVTNNRSTHGVDSAAELVAKYHLGGVIYFGWANNIADPEQIAGLSNGLQEAAMGDTGVPLFISTDQEHGAVVRIGPPVTQFPGNLALGASQDPSLATDSAVVISQELRAMGLNQNWAPVADVNVNPQNPVIGVRSFGADPVKAAEFTAAAVAGYQNEPGPMAASAKHFPGHGDTDVDSHTALPVITHDEKEWWELDAPPFVAAVDAGVDMIMSAHIRFPALDDTGTPATLSHPILTGLLREQLGYDGVVVTDSLSMEGVRQDHTDSQVPVEALKAGADLLLMPPDIDLAVSAVMEAVESGDLTAERIDESVLRVLELKHRRGLVGEQGVDVTAVSQTVGIGDHHAVAERVAAASVTAIRSDGDVLPLTGDTPVLVTGSGNETVGALAEAITTHGPTSTAQAAGDDPDPQKRREVTDAARKAGAVVVVTRNVAAHPAQAELVDELVATGTPVVVLSVAAPYDVNRLSAATVLATYSDIPVSLKAAAAVMCGQAEATGRLPVDVPVVDTPDDVLYPIGHGVP